MINIARELLTYYFITKTNSYTKYFVWPATILGVSLLGIGNFFYFFNDDREIGLYLLGGTIAIGSAIILHLVSIFSGKKMACSALEKIESSPGMIAGIALKQLSRFVSRPNGGFILSAIVPLGLIALILYKKKAFKR